MRKYTISNLVLIFTILFTAAIGISSCASIQQPSGGPKDTAPPKTIKETPPNLTRRFASKRIQIQFNEFIKLSNEFTEISISPAIDKMPTFKARKSILDVTFDQTLDENTTYTINFGKAIVDVNESNILKNYTYVFSTGDKIDSLSISGNVKSSTSKDVLSEATVFLLPVKQDTIFGKKRANIFTTTDSSGNFNLKNLREDRYFLYALKEESVDRVYNNPNELIGFLTDTVKLTANINGLELQVFKQEPTIFVVNEKKIEPDGKILLGFNKPLLNPTVSIISPPDVVKNSTFEISSSRDSAFIWLPEINFDSLRISVNDQGKPIDTIQVNRNKRDNYNRSVNLSDNLVSGKVKSGSDLILTLSSPISSFDQSKFELLQDSIKINGLQIKRDSLSLRKYKLIFRWRNERKYILKLAEGAFTDNYGNKSKSFTRNIELDSEENYGSIALEFTVPDTAKNYIIQWLNQEDKVLRTDLIRKNTILNYLKYPTSKYKVRVIYDENKNKIWDTGNVQKKRQPEKIWNYDKELALRPNWDLEEKIVIPKTL